MNELDWIGFANVVSASFQTSLVSPLLSPALWQHYSDTMSSNKVIIFAFFNILFTCTYS